MNLDRYRSLLLQLIRDLAASTTLASVGWEDFVSDGSPHLERLEQSIFEWSRLVAGLTATDGAVVLDKRCGVIGFGAEVSAELPAPAGVYRALDTEAHERDLDDIENVGTRHRAAYRFVNDHPEGLAVVVSQDGGVSFVADRDARSCSGCNPSARDVFSVCSAKTARSFGWAAPASSARAARSSVPSRCKDASPIRRAVGRPSSLAPSDSHCFTARPSRSVWPAAASSSRYSRSMFRKRSSSPLLIVASPHRREGRPWGRGRA
jgi:hypothetical protein